MITPKEHKIKHITKDIFIVGELQVCGFAQKHKFEKNVCFTQCQF